MSSDRRGAAVEWLAVWLGRVEVPAARCVYRLEPRPVGDILHGRADNLLRLRLVERLSPISVHQ